MGHLEAVRRPFGGQRSLNRVGMLNFTIGSTQVLQGHCPLVLHHAVCDLILQLGKYISLFISFVVDY